MQLPQLRISSQQAKIGIKQDLGTIEMRQPHAEMKIKQPHANIDYDIKLGKIKIDQSEAFADAGLKHVFRTNQEWVQKAKQKVLQGMAKNIQEGNQMMKIENGFGAIPRISKSSRALPQFSFNIGFVPSSASKVKFNHNPGDLQIKIKANKPQIDAQSKPPVIKYNKWVTNIYIRQKNSIDIQAVGVNINQIF